MSDWLLWATAIGAIATGVFTYLLWRVAAGTLGGTRDQLKLLREQAERDGRPYVTADIVTGLHGIGSWDLIVANSGRNMANEVTFTFDEWERRGDQDYITDGLIRYLHQAETLVPGARKRVWWRSEFGNSSGAKDEAGAPEEISVTVKYLDELEKQYETEFVLNLKAFSFATPAPHEGAETRGTPIDIAKSVANINHALRALNGHIGELRR